MESNGASNTRAQPSIRSFFQPRQPTYTAPPLPLVSKPEIPAPPMNGMRTPPRSSPQPTQSSPPKAAKSSSIPPEATICVPASQHIQPLRRINALLLPISYPDSFYNDVLKPKATKSFSRIITWTEPTPPSEPKVIGGIVCRLDPALAPDSTPSAPKYLEGFEDIYVQSLGLLSPYRGHGLAAAALQEIIDAATSQNEVKIASLYAHVWSGNEEAVGWYEKQGFKREEQIVKGYYKRLNPDSAWIFRRRIVVGDHLASIPTSQTITKSTSAPAPSSDSALRPAPVSSARSFQERGPDREWNDLPEDVLANPLSRPPSHLASQVGSEASSRSSSRSGVDKASKKKRVYPTAAYGGSR